MSSAEYPLPVEADPVGTWGDDQQDVRAHRPAGCHAGLRNQRHRSASIRRDRARAH